MGALKIKNGLGEWESLPIIKGDVGPQGPQGEIGPQGVPGEVQLSDLTATNIDYTDTNSNLGDATDVQTALDNVGTQLASHLAVNWIAPTLLNGWVNAENDYETAGYYKDSFGIVHMKGVVKSGTSGQHVFILPEGYRPALAKRFVSAANDAFAQIIIEADGRVKAYGSNIWLTLENISFRVT